MALKLAHEQNLTKQKIHHKMELALVQYAFQSRRLHCISEFQSRRLHSPILPPSQNKCSFALFTFNVWSFVLFEKILWLVFLLLLDDKTWIVLYMWLNIFKFFTNFSNKTDGQTLVTDIHGCTYFGTEVLPPSQKKANSGFPCPTLTVHLIWNFFIICIFIVVRW